MRQAQLPRGTVTFLFTDIEGSTSLLHQLGVDDYEVALGEHRRVLREAFVRHGGVEVDTQGDAFFVVFPTAPGALAAAAESRNALARGPIRVRMGLHSGPAHLGEEGYVGADVHLGARIAAAGHGGQILLSAATRAQIDGELEDLGEHRVKDFADPIWIYQLGTERFPPLKTISNTNLPRPASSFVGRERETAEVVALLRDGTRLLTLTGAGGSGKTRLAIEAAVELVPKTKHGVFWIGLAALRDRNLVLDTVAQVLGSQNGLAEHIGERDLLLLLDNFEQVVSAAPELSRLLRACPNLRLLVTSRELLRIDGEREYAVPPLAEPDAVELFSRRSGLEADGAVAELCTRLDNLPLAVELAAARTSVLSPAQILERLGQRLDVLRGGRDADPRQATLRATIAWSDDLLDAEERGLFARLAVFRGGCTLDAAEAVAEATLDTLQSLVDKSLVRHTNDRFWMLEMIREYALERLAEDGAEPALRRRHAEYFVGFAEKLALWESTDHSLAGFAADHDNLRSALAWARDLDADETLLRLTVALRDYWRTRGFDREAREWLALALRRAPSQSSARFDVLIELARYAINREAAAEAHAFGAEALDAAEREGDRHRQLLALNVLARAKQVSGDLGGARALFIELRRQADELDDIMMQAFAATNLGLDAILDGDLEAALTLSAEAVDLHRKSGSEGGVVISLGNSAWAALGLGDHARALQWFQDVLVVAERLGDVMLIRGVAAGVAAIFAATGEGERAATLLGAEARMRDELELEMDPFEKRICERAVAEARAALGEEAFAAAWARGKAMTQDEIARLCYEAEVTEGARASP